MNRYITVHEFNSYSGDLMVRRSYPTEAEAIAAATKLREYRHTNGYATHYRITRRPKIIMNYPKPA